MRHVVTFTAAVVMGLAALTGCSGGDGSDYCERVRSNADDKALDNIDLETKEGLKTLLVELKKLRTDAPDEVEDDYDALISALENPETAAVANLEDRAKAIEKYDEEHCDVEHTNS